MKRNNDFCFNILDLYRRDDAVKQVENKKRGCSKKKNKKRGIQSLKSLIQTTSGQI